MGAGNSRSQRPNGNNPGYPQPPGYTTGGSGAGQAMMSGYGGYPPQAQVPGPYQQYRPQHPPPQQQYPYYQQPYMANNRAPVPPQYGQNNQGPYVNRHPGPNGMARHAQSPHPPPTPPPQPLPDISKTTVTIRNDVNLKKTTLKIVPMVEGDWSNVKFRFTFDSTTPCNISFFMGAKESEGNAITGDIVSDGRMSFEKGLSQDFELPTAVSLEKYSEGQLLTHTETDFPVIIRMERLDEAAVERGEILPEPPGASLPEWVQAQTTYAVLELNADRGYEIKVLSQKIWVQGTIYELKEIYGIEKTVGTKVAPDSVGDEFAEDGEGSECVICLSEPRNTTVFPCRHLCMCRDCAKMLSEQTNRCPVCRTKIEGMLEIKMRERGESAPPCPPVTEEVAPEVQAAVDLSLTTV